MKSLANGSGPDPMPGIPCAAAAGTGAPSAAPAPLTWPAGITTIIGFALFAAIRLSRMKPARPTELHESSTSPAPCSR